MTIELDAGRLGDIRQANDDRRRRKEAAQPGPWRYYDGRSGPVGRLVRGPVPLIGPDISTPADYDFICAARSDPVEDHVDYLLSLVDTLTKRVHELTYGPDGTVMANVGWRGRALTAERKHREVLAEIEQLRQRLIERQAITDA